MGTAKPDISSAEALRRVLLAAKSIAYSDSASGVYVSTELFSRLGIADQVAGKSRMIPAEPVGAVVARGDAEIGFQQMSELKPIPGIELVGTLPSELQKITVFSAGVVVGTKKPDTARALSLISPLLRRLLRLAKAGWSPFYPRPRSQKTEQQGNARRLRHGYRRCGRACLLHGERWLEIDTIMNPEEAISPTETLNPVLNRFSLLHGALLAVVGGFLDAFTFLEKGNVFANAMTGNVVLLGVFTATRNWLQAGGHLLPIVAFLAGIVVSEILKRPRVLRAVHWPATICLVTEAILLLVAGSLPSNVPDYFFTLSISFVATLQNSMFPKIEKETINTVMTTGNL